MSIQVARYEILTVICHRIMRSASRRSGKATSTASRSINFVADLGPDMPSFMQQQPQPPPNGSEHPSGSPQSPHAGISHKAGEATRPSASPRMNLASAFDHADEPSPRDHQQQKEQPSNQPKFTLGSLPSFVTTPRRRTLRGKNSPGKPAAAGSFTPSVPVGPAPLRPPVAPTPGPALRYAPAAFSASVLRPGSVFPKAGSFTGMASSSTPLPATGSFAPPPAPAQPSEISPPQETAEVRNNNVKPSNGNDTTAGQAASKPSTTPSFAFDSEFRLRDPTRVNLNPLGTAAAASDGSPESPATASPAFVAGEAAG